MTPVGDAQDDLLAAIVPILHDILPQTKAYSLDIIISEKNRKKRFDAALDSWQPALGEITFKFGIPEPATIPGTTETVNEISLGISEGSAEGQPPDFRFHDLINTLNDAEMRPGFEFVSLKWFRDTYLPGEQYDWAKMPRFLDAMIRAAISDGVLLTSKVTNPRSPQFPVTAIRLNRRHKDVVLVLGESSGFALNFRPVPIGGEPLSDTVLRDRG